MAPKYPFGTRSDGASFSPKAPGAVRIAGTNPNALARLSSLVRPVKRVAAPFLRYGLGPAVDAYFGYEDVKQAAEEGRNVPRAVGREIVEIAGGLGGAALPGVFGVPSGGASLVAVPAAYLGGSTSAGALYDQVMNQVMGEDIPVKPEKEVMYGTLPPSARVVTDYPEGIPTGVGGGNMGSYRPESVAPTVSEEPVREQGSAAALPGQSTTLSTPKAEGDDMQSELLKEAMTMRRAKEMAELGIYGGEQATTKGSKMYEWVRTHGDLADDLIRDKRMKEVRIARMFGRDLPTDAAGMDGQMGNFEAFEGMREMA